MTALGLVIFALLLVSAFAAGFWAGLAGETYYRMVAEATGDSRVRLDLDTALAYAVRPWAWFVAWPRTLEARLQALGQRQSDARLENARQRYVYRRRLAYGLMFAVVLVGIPVALHR